MRVPLEILRDILDFAAQDYDRSQLMTLREVSSVFDSEICVFLFSNRYHSKCYSKVSYRRTDLQSKKWLFIPSSLQQRYLWIRARHAIDSEFWRKMFLPAFERHLDICGLDQASHATRSDHLWKCLSFSRHSHWNSMWAVTSDEKRKLENRFINSEYGAVSLEVNYHCRGDDAKTKIRRTIENDAKFLEMLFAISRNDVDAVLGGFYGSYFAPDELSITFGTTLIGCAISFGTCEMLKLLLRSIKSISVKRVLYHLRLTFERGQERHSLSHILLNHFYSVAKSKRSFLCSLINQALLWDDAPLFGIIWEWYTSVPHDYPEQKSALIWLQFSPSWRLINTGRYTDEAKLPQEFRSTRQSPLSPPISLAPNGDHDRIEIRRQKKAIEVGIGMGGLTSPQIWHWTGWLLWASANPRHSEGKILLKNHGPDCRRRAALRKLVGEYGWDLRRVEAFIEYERLQ